MPKITGENLRGLQEEQDFELSPEGSLLVRDASPLTENPRMSLDRRKLLDDLQDLKEEFSMFYREMLRELLNEIKQKPKGNIFLTDKITDFLAQKKMDEPVVEIYDKIEGQKFLQKFVPWHKLKDDSFVLVFELPKPLAYFWAKNSGNYFRGQPELVTEWGRLYEQLAPKVWGFMNTFSREHDLQMNRVNEIGDHSPGDYYYIWEVSRDFSF